MKNGDLSALITALGGRRALQELLGVGPSAISNYLAKEVAAAGAWAGLRGPAGARYQIDPASLEITGERVMPVAVGTGAARKGARSSVAASPPRRSRWRGGRIMTSLSPA